MSELDGVLRVDKPVGPTSHDVVGMARRGLGTRRVGHTGTLDPFASGLLLLCVGPATRLAEYLTALPKSYRATLRLGAVTDTDDHTGAVISASDAWRSLTEAQVRAALEAQVGTLQQIPPLYSAKRVDGERMYDRARRGEAVERHPVEVVVHGIEVERVELPEVEFVVHCGSGTYIRSIARDAGETLGAGAHLTALRRTRVGEHRVDDAVPAGDLADAAAVRRAMLAPADALGAMPRLTLDEEGERHVRHGRAVEAPDAADGEGAVALLTPDGALLAIAERHGARLQPRKVFA